ncbi:MAG TPA: type I-MYXAN CRISPR-associated Cas8a1/Cmx1 [Leptospiraceae bacterium]|nr:type I-MYXAN CRISPR-associated Cas8a1/Cmx1 [Leptospiraceae bacterium]HNF12640.1 type I-MYXAN CRISPR-associated Cas8a1/Cmx1 [Leptospiraceae bacterium]HNM02175.1 type I-MYXAN CRISPR-associated Cas8a1/Cmx1 [Leptospiraceae bacterium]HNN06710.1 type I-MYXAN CRISPR-associated Cas8a1/Cmx1 [Leptospiraceae bacterium]
MAELKLSLSNPGMSDLHKVGLGGLYMTLKSLDQKKKKIAGLEYTFDATNVTLQFDDKKLGQALEELIKYSFQIDNQGFIYFPALELRGAQPIENKLINQKSLLQTFFQPTLFSSKTEKAVQMNFSGDDQRPLVVSFQKVLSYSSQQAMTFLYNQKKNIFQNEIEIKNWLYIGGAVKHSGLGNNTILSERMETFFPLLYATVGCIFVYVKVHDAHLRTKIRACIIIPNIDDLESFAQVRSKIALSTELKLTMAGLSESALYFAEESAGIIKTKLKKFPVITVIGIGDTKWNSTQRSKNFVYKVSLKDDSRLHQYKLISKVLKSSIRELKEEKDKKGNIKKPKSTYVSVPISKELFCENIVNKKSFYNDFYKLVKPSNDSSGKLFYKIKYETKELNEMVNKIAFDHEAERVFINACHTAWKRRLGKLGGDAKKTGGGSFGNLVARDFERLRVSLVKSKNLESFRETITDFWSRAGNIPVLRDNWDKAMVFFENENWKKGRDLALLALVSYKPEDKDEEKMLSALETQENSVEGEDE